MSDAERFINHKCIITIDPKGNQVHSEKIISYRYMNSGTYEENPRCEYLGYGRAVSCFDSLYQIERTINMEGHFWK